MRALQVLTRCVAKVLLFGGCAFALDQPAGVPPHQLFDEAYRASTQLESQDRATILSLLIRAVRPVSPDRCKKWSVELFRLGPALSTDERGAIQETALVQLSAVDPHLAARMFTLQEPPASTPNSEDNRVYAAVALFSALWARDGARSLRTIERLSQWQGATGAYPYPAMVPVILAVNKTDRFRAQQLFLDAVRAFSPDAPFADVKYQYVDFLRATRDVPSPGILRETLNAAVAAIEKTGTNKDQIHVELRAGEKTVGISSEAESLLLQLLPLVKDSDRTLYERLVAKHEGFARNEEIVKGKYTSGGVVLQGGRTPGPLVQEALDQSRANEAIQTAQNDPSRAMSSARNIATPHIRAITIASILPWYAEVDALASKNWINDLTKQVEQMGASPAKLRLEVALTNALFATSRSDEAQAMASKAMDLGVELFKQDRLANPGKRAYTTVGFDELIHLSETLGKNLHSLGSLDMVQQVRDEVLRAAMLVTFGKGLADRSHK